MNVYWCANTDELRDVTKVMTKNIEDLLYRGDSLERMNEVSGRLREDARKYKKAAARINWELLLKQYGPVGGLVFIMIVFIWWRFFWFRSSSLHGAVCLGLADEILWCHGTIIFGAGAWLYLQGKRTLGVWVAALNRISRHKWLIWPMILTFESSAWLFLLYSDCAWSN